MPQAGVAERAPVVMHHLLHNGFGADDYKHLFGSRYRRVKEISVIKLIKSAKQRDYHRRELAALALVNGNGIGKLQLFQHFKGIFRNAPLEVDDHSALATLYLYYSADIAVENSRAVLAVLFPDNIVVIFGLHHLIAVTEGEKYALYLGKLLFGGLSTLWSILFISTEPSMPFREGHST